MCSCLMSDGDLLQANSHGRGQGNPEGHGDKSLEIGAGDLVEFSMPLGCLRESGQEYGFSSRLSNSNTDESLL